MKREMILEYVIEFLTLISGRIPLNICKVMTAAFGVGAFFSFGLADSDCYIKALLMLLACLLLACFFGTLTAIGMEVDGYEEDDFVL